MPIFKTEILGTKIEINYKKDELNKLSNLIEIFKNRLEEFSSGEGVNNKTVMFLAALKAEDELEELRILFNKNKKHTNELTNSKVNNQKLQNEIIGLNSELQKLKILFNSEKKNNNIVVKELNELVSLVEFTQNKIKNLIE